MEATEKKQSVWVWAALAATLTATAWLEVSDSHIEESSAATPAPRISGQFLTSTDNNKALSVDFNPRTLIKSKPGELFTVDGSEQLQAEESLQPEPVPTTPRLPFVYAGKLIDDKEPAVFLFHDKQNLVVRKGDVIDELWQVVSIGSSEMRFKYLPLHTQTSLIIGEKN